jgi:hypothetical protein
VTTVVVACRSRRADEDFVNYINSVVAARSMSADAVLAAEWSQLAPTPTEGDALMSLLTQYPGLASVRRACEEEATETAQAAGAGATSFPWIAVLCCAVLCCAVLCCAVLCCALVWYLSLAQLSHDDVRRLQRRRLTSSVRSSIALARAGRCCAL